MGVSGEKLESMRALLIKSRTNLPSVIEEHYERGIISEETYNKLKNIIKGADVLR